MSEVRAECGMKRGAVIYQDPVFLVFGQNNGRYPTENSLKENSKFS